MAEGSGRGGWSLALPFEMVFVEIPGIVQAGLSRERFPGNAGEKRQGCPQDRFPSCPARGASPPCPGLLQGVWVLLSDLRLRPLCGKRCPLLLEGGEELGVRETDGAEFARDRSELLGESLGWSELGNPRK